MFDVKSLSENLVAIKILETNIDKKITACPDFFNYLILKSKPYQSFITSSMNFSKNHDTPFSVDFFFIEEEHERIFSLDFTHLWISIS